MGCSVATDQYGYERRRAQQRSQTCICEVVLFSPQGSDPNLEMKKKNLSPPDKLEKIGSCVCMETVTQSFDG